MPRHGFLQQCLLLATLATLPLHGAWAAAKFSAAAKLDAKTGNVMVTGTAVAGARVFAYDALNQNSLYTILAGAKGKYSMSLTLESAPCLVRVTSGGSEVVAKVGGAPAACKTAVTCSIATPPGDAMIRAGDALSFSVSGAAKSKKGPGIEYVWNMGDGSEDMQKAALDYPFPDAGQYRVTLNGFDAQGNKLCGDYVNVSVSPRAGANPNGKVKELDKPGIASAMPTASGGNDVNAYVVLPFEEMGMMGGSMVNLPFNPLIPYNALNAQVLQKVAHKPPLLDASAVDAFYSAASNPNDPVGGDSINSTSQNLFADGQAGANFDPVASLFDPSKKLPTDNKFIAGHDYQDAVIRKNELWDRIHQPYAKDVQKIPETGRSIADTQSTATPAYDLALPDQSMRGYVDGGLGTRNMPGIANPYKANDPQKIDYNPDQQAFVAQFIPASDIDDQGRVNPYPLFRVEARDKSGQTLAKTDAVYTTASETRCRECHLPGGKGANDEVWRTPVTEAELTKPDGTPGPATGAGSFAAGADPSKPWPPAVNNRFDDKHPDNPSFTNLAPGVNDPASPAFITRDQNGLRTDRVKASRWAKFDLATGKPTGETGPTKPADATGWRLQLQLKFRNAQDYGGDSWVEQEKAALFNTLVMHDYMVFYGPTPAAGKLWPASYSTQVADSYADDVGKNRAQPMYFCAGHHYSQIKFDNGVAARSYPTNRSDYSRAYHAFHGKMQVYAQDASAAESADGLAHKKGELVRDERGHPKMFGGRGWDSQHNDDNGVPLKPDADGKFTVKTVPAYDPGKNNWAPELYPMHAKGELMLPFGENVPMEENCIKCHTGPTEKSYRDIHTASGLKCDNCHSDMLAVGNVYPNHGYDANLTGGGAYTGETVHFRRPWLDEPDCGSCHMGDGNLVDYSAGAMKTAWDAGDKSGRTRDPLNARFAVMPHKEERPEKATVNGVTTFVKQPISQALYRKSADVHGSGANGQLTCSTCHGGSHAIWPNPDPKANDNVTALQLQGYDGNIAECSVCHIKDDFKDGLIATDGGASGLGVGQGVRDGTVVNAKSPKAFLAGPHGIHPVGDPYWYKEAPGTTPNQSGTTTGGWHNEFAKKPGPDGEDQCAACHGKDHKGTRLSKTLTDRVLTDEKGKDVKVTAGQIIGCDLCHSLDKSFIGSPTGTAKNHPPPKPEPIAAGASTGGGGGGH
jgi:hypothetical protein